MRRLIDRSPGDPRLGLAIDEALFEALQARGDEAVRFWINLRAVVVGRSQAVADEVDLRAAEDLATPVLRRISGGGAVVHYPGNLNLSIVLASRPAVHSVGEVFRFFGEAIASAVADAFTAETADGPGPERPIRAADNALLLGDAKIGGAAQARRGDAILYHTTLLLEPDEIPMGALLRAMRPGYAPIAVASRPRPTTTLAEETEGPIDVERIIEAICIALADRLGVALDEGRIDDRVLARAEALRDGKYGDDGWNRSR